MRPTPLQRASKDYMIILQNAACTSIKSLKGLHDYTTECSLHPTKGLKGLHDYTTECIPHLYKGPERTT